MSAPPPNASPNTEPEAAVNRPSGQRLLVLWMACALFLLFLGMSLTPLTNNDVWLHMANGRLILQQHEVPLTDPYSFSAEGHRFHAHEWLAGVAFHLVHQASGVNGLILFKTLLGGCALILVLLTARREGAGSAAMGWTALLALVIVNSRFLERPEMFSFAFTGLYLWVLSREHHLLEEHASAGAALPRPLWSLLWWLVPVQWAWVQIHGYFLTGLALVGTFMVAITAQAAWRGITSSQLKQRLISGWSALAAMAVLGLVNPNGFEIYLFPFQLAGGDNLFMQTVFEWKPTFTTPIMTQSSMFLAFALWLALLMTSPLADRRQLQAAGLWRAVGMLSVAGLALLRPVLASGRSLPETLGDLYAGRQLIAEAGPAGTGLPASTWFWSPAELLASISGHYGFRTLLDPLFSPLRLLGEHGDELFTILILALLAVLILCWRHPRMAGLAALIVCLTFLISLIGSWAMGFLMLCLLAGLGWMVWQGTLPLWLMANAAVFLVLAVRQNRNIVNFTLVTLPILAPALSRGIQAGDTRRSPAGPRLGIAVIAATASLLALLTFQSGWPYTPTIPKKMGLGVGARIPTQAVEYIRDKGLGGKVFNKYAYGAYLIHELYPETRVFMDSRNGVYGETLYRRYLQTLLSADEAARTFDEFDFDYVVVDYHYPGRSEDRGLLAYLESQPDWVLVEFNDRSLIYVRDREPNRDLVRREGYRHLNPGIYRPGSVRQGDSARRASFDLETRQALARHPEGRTTRLLRAEAELMAGRHGSALELLEGVVRDHESDFFALLTAARAAAGAGDPEKAGLYYRRALAMRPALEALQAEALPFTKENS